MVDKSKTRETEAEGLPEVWEHHGWYKTYQMLDQSGVEQNMRDKKRISVIKKTDWVSNEIPTQDRI